MLRLVVFTATSTKPPWAVKCPACAADYEDGNASQPQNCTACGQPGVTVGGYHDVIYAREVWFDGDVLWYVDMDGTPRCVEHFRRIRALGG